MRVLVFGGSGQVGRALLTRLDPSWQVEAPSSSTVPLDSIEAVAAAIDSFLPDAILNAAAHTRVDDAEKEPERAHRLNAEAPGVMATMAVDRGFRFVHVSTDYVFDGTGRVPYTIDAPPRAVNVYGASKLAGERAVLQADPGAVVLRTAWVHSGSGNNFVGTAVKILRGGNIMNVVDDQVGTPTRATTVAEMMIRCLERPNVRGVHHVTDAGVASWYDVACCVRDTLDRVGLLPSGAAVVPVSSASFPRPAARPAVSILDTHATRDALAWQPSSWRDGVIASTLEWAR